MRLRAILVAVSILLSVPAQAALPVCSSEGERQAMVVRAFQSYLMVAAVACNQAPAYNKFITRFQAPVSAQGNALKGYFRRVYGAGADRQLNGFITGLANAWAQVHMQDMTTYCKGTWDMMWKLEREPQASSATLVSSALGVVGQPAVTDEMCGGAVSATQVAQAAPSSASASSAASRRR